MRHVACLQQTTTFCPRQSRLDMQVSPATTTALHGFGACVHGSDEARGPESSSPAKKLRKDTSTRPRARQLLLLRFISGAVAHEVWRLE